MVDVLKSLNAEGILVRLRTHMDIGQLEPGQPDTLGLYRALLASCLTLLLACSRSTDGRKALLVEEWEGHKGLNTIVVLLLQLLQRYVVLRLFIPLDSTSFH